MAKITITVQDMPNGQVEVKCEPSMEILFKMVASGNELTSAQGYAAKALNEIRKAAKAEGRIRVEIPRIGR